MAFLGLDEDDQIYDDEAYYEEERPVERPRRSSNATIALEDRLGGTAAAGGFGFRADLETETGGVGAVRPLRVTDEEAAPVVPDSLAGMDERRSSVSGGFQPFTNVSNDAGEDTQAVGGITRLDAVPDEEHPTRQVQNPRPDNGTTALRAKPNIGIVDPATSGGDPPRTTSQPVGSSAELHAVTYAKPRLHMPGSFDDASRVADDFRAGSPVVVNLSMVDKPVARRIIDFASGVCYVLSGGMERLASNVYLLTPSGVDVSGDDRRRMQERGYER
jgi:cell division inhibitor SepF